MPATIDEALPTLGAPPGDLLRGATLFLDFDGTLVDLAPAPDAITPAAELPAVLRGVAATLDSRVAIVSGRPVAEIRQYLGGSLAIAGSHGAEIAWPDGRTEALPVPDWIEDAVRRAEGFAGEHPGVLVERKPYGLALHYRRAPDAGPACRAFAEALAEGADRELQAGKMVFELRATGADKGGAVNRFMQDAALAGTRPVFVGDDLTDEAGFAAANALGGAGVLVGPLRTTAAGYALPDVAATLAWLGANARVSA